MLWTKADPKFVHPRECVILHHYVPKYNDRLYINDYSKRSLIYGTVVYGNDNDNNDNANGRRLRWRLLESLKSGTFRGTLDCTFVQAVLYQVPWAGCAPPYAYTRYLNAP